MQADSSRNRRRDARPGRALFCMLFLVFTFVGLALAETEPGPAAPEQPLPSDQQTPDAAPGLQELFDQQLEGNEPQTEPEETSEGLRIGEGHTISYQQGGYNMALDIAAAADFVGAWDNDTPASTKNEFEMREVELLFTAYIDHLAKGVVSLAAHREEGETLLEAHEIYFEFPNFFLPNTSARLGKMFLDVGRLNSIHRHDWPFTNAPAVHENLLASEAADDTGLELSFLFPWSFWQELTVGVYNGKTFGHSHVEGDTKQNPLFTAHLKQFIPFTENLGDQFGFSYLRFHPTTSSNQVSHQYGFDHTIRWDPSTEYGGEWWTEVWYRETREKNERRFDPPAVPIETRVGAYSYVGARFLREWTVGYRWGFFTNPNFRNDRGQKQIRNGIEQNAIIVSYHPSEFSTFRATAERTTERETGKNTYQYYAQADFILGFHPAHEY